MLAKFQARGSEPEEQALVEKYTFRLLGLLKQVE